MNALEEPTVAVVDDDEAVRSALVNLLSSLDIAAVSFPSAEAFLDAPARREAACLVCDIQMSGMSGLDLQRRLVAEGSRMPVILLTAFPRDHVRRDAEAEGAFAFFAKPFDGARLADCIEKALASRQG
jgi:FixJ family two-component response regulator